ncbi:MAG: hypothetical protein HDR51_08035 [Treponema sp.]|nr:hypothetical protein [Treponema sp.]
MIYSKKGVSRLICAIFKEALCDRDFGFIDTSMGRLALMMLEDGDRMIMAFRMAEEGKPIRDIRRGRKRRSK